MAENPRLMHSVVFWLAAGTPDTVATEMAAFYYQRIAKVGGVELVYCGRPAGTERDVVDSTYQVSSTVIFRDADAQSAWQVDPVHDEFRERFGPSFSRVVVYDTLELL